MGVEQKVSGATVAPVLSVMEMGAVLGKMDQVLTDFRIPAAREQLVGDQAKGRFDQMIQLFETAGNHAMRNLIVTFSPRYFPEQAVGETAQVLYLLMLGAGSHRGNEYLNTLASSYRVQLGEIAKKSDKEPETLTLVDLGEALIDGSFNPTLL